MSSEPNHNRQKNHKALTKKQKEAIRRKKRQRKIILLIVEILVVLILAIALFLISKLGKIERQEVPLENIEVNEGISEESKEIMKSYTTIALFGLDNRSNGNLSKGRSDVIMIANINNDTKEVKLCSVFRDSYLDTGDGSFKKCNAAYAKGGPMQAINMLNMNLDMNITDFVTVGFSGLTETIDALGGVYIDVKEEEISHLNNYQISIVGTTKDGKTYTAAEGSYTPVTQAGYQKLNGLQATAYCRIRYVGNDFERTARQRRVLKAVADEAKKASPAQLEKIANSVFDKVYTSLDISEIVSLLGNISKYNIVDEGGFPNSDMLTTGSIGKKGSCVVPRSLESNVTWLHEFLFDEKDYEPSSAVKEYSAKIAADTNGYVK